MKKNSITNRIKTCLSKFRAKRKKELREKIKALYQASYDFYLKNYLRKVKKYNIVDIPAFLYLSGDVICKSAADQALDAVIDYAVSQGIRRVNKCYKCLLKDRQTTSKD